MARNINGENIQRNVNGNDASPGENFSYQNKILNIAIFHYRLFFVHL